jgi:hypothetical protein
MARRANPAAGETATTEHDEQTPLVGGSAGVLETTHNELTHGQPTASATREPDPDAPPPPKVRRFIVEGAGPAGRGVMLDGYRANFRDGKICSEKDYDIEVLRAQGVRLRELEG